MSIAQSIPRTWRWIAAVVAVALFATVLATGVGLGVDRAAAQDTVTCYAIADGTVDGEFNNQTTADTLVRIDNALGAPDGVIVATLTSLDAEAMAIRQGAGPNYIWAWDSGLNLFLINPATGAQTAAPFAIPGKVEGLSWANGEDNDPTNDVLWSVLTNGDVFSYNASGAQLSSSNIASGALNEGADIAWDPTTDTVYALRTNASDTTELVVVGGGVSGGTEFDLEGLGFTDSGQMIGTSGNDGADSLHSVNKANGATAVLLNLLADPGVLDHEDVDCLELEPADPGVITAAVATTCVGEDGKITATITHASGDDPVDYSVAITGQADITGTINSGDTPAMAMSASTLADGSYTVTVTNTTAGTEVVTTTETVACDIDPAIPAAGLAVTCENNDGKITVNIANNAAAGAASADFTVTVAGQAPVTATLAPGETDDPMFTGLADGTYSVTVSADGI